jgi:hypothetical protein
MEQQSRSNKLGLAGFVLSIITIFLGWIPVLGWLIWIVGLTLSFAGIFKQPRGLAIAGLVISVLGVILLFVGMSALAVL